MVRRWQTATYAELNTTLADALGAKTAEPMAKLGYRTVGDLVRTVPYRYISGTGLSDLGDLVEGLETAVVARVARDAEVHFQNRFRVTTRLTDGFNEVNVTLFAAKKHIANYWAEKLKRGVRGIFIGKVTSFKGQPQLQHPNFALLDANNQVNAKRDKMQIMNAVRRETMVGLYPATSGLPTWTTAESIDLLLPGLDGLDDPLPQWLRDRAEVIDFYTALVDVHQPRELAQAERGIERLKFDEAITTQIALAYRRAAQRAEQARVRVAVAGGLLEAFDARLPFELTAGQREVSGEILTDLATPRPMNRLLQGEVGSGKTVVALRAMLTVVDSGGQAVLLAPTEVLAKQHYATITTLLGDLADGALLTGEVGTGVALLTGSRSTSARKQTLADIASGNAGIVVGTHALLSDPVTFADLGLVVVDEQHRFGVEQRSALSAKAEVAPHVLIMTATPIPRSVAMTMFGDLEVSSLRELPAGRAAVQTTVVDTHRNPHWVERAWQRIREEVGNGRQAFVVCPAIDAGKTEADMDAGAGELTTVVGLHSELVDGPLQGLRVGMVHGRQSADERDKAMHAFAAGELDVMVATTVIEVGVDVPNASVMVVMDADRFGISQLHQLRGRIGRGEHEGLCLLVANLSADLVDARARLQAVAASRDGFELAETDLQIRREGNVLGAAQSGARSALRLLRVTDDIDVIEQARSLAEDVVAADPDATQGWVADLITQTEEAAAADWLERS